MTDPLVPAGVDLRGYGFMPLYGNHLFGSDFNSRVTDAGWRAAVTLWWAAWNQVPAASLPDDDIALCRLADLGRDVKSFVKLRKDALHGFVLCSDGRLYHRYLATLALEAWERRVAERNRKAKYRAYRNSHKNGDGDIPETGTDHHGDGDNIRDKHGTQGGTMQGRPGREGEGEGEGQGPLDVPKELHGEPSAVDNSQLPCSDKSESSKPKSNGKRYATPGWWTSEKGIVAKGEELHMPPKKGEAYPEYKQRLFDAINHAKAGA